jgi:2-polyprenyl-6-methoxyphenol hydroxylase-like FAD-dependent oxidoreductase
MTHTDVAIVGGGLAGSLCAVMLGRAGYRVTLIDPNQVYPPEFRCEKIVSEHIEPLRRIGVSELVLERSSRTDEMWIVRGCILERRRLTQFGIRYETLVNTVREAIPAGVDFQLSKATAIASSDDVQTVRLLNGEEVTARLIVLATGLNNSLRQDIGIARHELSKCHSISIGFNAIPACGTGFEFPSLTYYGEKPQDRIGYLSLFPIGDKMRANLFVYWGAKDAVLRAMRTSPAETLLSIMPKLERITGKFEVEDLQIRPMDVYQTANFEHAGLVLVGDTFATSCPAAGTGVSKVLTDTERLCRSYIPAWLAEPGMPKEKTGAFYRDNAKVTRDSFSISSALYERSTSIDLGLAWRARRAARSAKLIVGALGLREPLQRLALALTNARMTKGPVLK